MARVIQKTPPQAVPPPQLATAIQNASTQYGIPPDLLIGIWHVESGSTYPNPYVNSSGYGGLFGIPNTTAQGAPYNGFAISGSPQEQANLAASILSKNLQSANGNVATALGSYSGGGYNSVPGETTFGTIHGFKTNSGGGGIENAVVGAAATGFNTIFNGTGINSTDIGLPASSSLQSDAVNAALPSISGVGKEVLYGIALLGGGLMVIAGLLLIGVDIGLGAYRGTKRNPTIQVITSGASKTRDKFKPSQQEESPANKPVSLAERREQRQADLHRAKLRRARAEARIREHQAVEAKHRGQRARSVTEQETANLNIFK